MLVGCGYKNAGLPIARLAAWPLLMLFLQWIGRPEPLWENMAASPWVPTVSFVHILLIFLGFSIVPAVSSLLPTSHQYDVVIYGNTVAAISAAIQTARMNTSVAIVFPGDYLGGLTTSGLGWTDSKDGDTIGGIAREFYGKIFDYYKDDDVWEYGTRSEYIDKNIQAQPGKAIEEKKKVQWTFEPKVAEEILEKWVDDENIPIYRNEWIDRENGVVKDGSDIKSFKTESGSVFSAKMFIDAGYEGDLMEAANISYRVGREGRNEYNESAAGTVILKDGQLSGIDAWNKGDGRSRSRSLISGIQRVIGDRATVQGDADPIRLQSYNYRLCLTKEDGNKISFKKPFGYNESEYEILFRYIESGYSGPFFTDQYMPNLKTDTNAAGQVSTDLIGGNYNKDSNYAEYSYKQREECASAHKRWAEGLLWSLANHERVPEFIRKDIETWGYAKDEFVDNYHWPYELYIREGRRMSGMYTMTQEDIQHPKERSHDSVAAVAYYTLDVHQVERVVIGDRIYDEGLVHVPSPGPFVIPFGAIIPNADNATNFLNPVTLSGTHVALSAIRMEPAYMVLGQTAATAAVLAIQEGVKIQDVDRKKLTKRLKADGQVLEASTEKLDVPYWILTATALSMAYAMF